MYVHEPLERGSPLFAFDNVVLTSRIASATHETRMRMAQRTLEVCCVTSPPGHAITPVTLPQAVRNA